MHNSELCLTDTHCVLKHRIEHWLQLTGRTADHFQNVGSRCLLLQRFTQVVSALAQLVKQPRILDSDDGLRSKRFKKLALLFGERPRRRAHHTDCADCGLAANHRS
jgi:hypothetical protein